MSLKFNNECTHLRTTYERNGSKQELLELVFLCAIYGKPRYMLSPYVVQKIVFFLSTLRKKVCKNSTPQSSLSLSLWLSGFSRQKISCSVVYCASYPPVVPTLLSTLPLLYRRKPKKQDTKLKRRNFFVKGRNN